MLYQLYRAHEKRVNPTGLPEKMAAVTTRLKKLVPRDEWVVPVGGNRKDKELTIAQWIVGPEPALNEFFYVTEVKDWNWDPYGGYGGGGCTRWMQARQKARGFVRRSVWEAHAASGITPYLASRP